MTSINIEKLSDFSRFGSLSIAQLKEEQKQLNFLLDNTHPNSEEFRQYRYILDLVNDEIKAFEKNLLMTSHDVFLLEQSVDLSTLSINELKDRQKLLNQVLNDCDPQTQEFVNYRYELADVNKKLQEMDQLIKKSSISIDNLSENVDLSTWSMNQLKERQKELIIMMADLDPNTPTYDTLRKNLIGVNEQINNLDQGTKMASINMEKLSDFSRFGSLSIAQLKEEQKQLNFLLDNTHPNSEEFQQYRYILDLVNDEIKAFEKNLLMTSHDVFLLDQSVDLATLSINELKDRQKLLNQVLNDCDPQTQEFVNYRHELAEVTKKLGEMDHIIKKSGISIDDLSKKVDLSTMSMNQLKERQKELIIMMADLDPNTPTYDTLRQNLIGVNEQIDNLDQGTKETKFSFGKLADDLNRYQTLMATVGVAFFGAYSAIGSYLQGSAKLSEEMVDVMQTTEMTKEEVDSLHQQFKTFNTRTARKELNEIAAVAGQLGVKKSQIGAFTDSMNKLATVMKSQFGGSAEDVATEIGTLRNVLGDMQTKNIDQDLLHLGNAMDVLGKAGFATSPVITDFAKRIGGVGSMLGLTSGEILGLSATMQELAINPERGGTAVVKILQKMTTQTEAFANAAGYTGDKLKDFSNLVNTDIYSAFLKVIEGSQSSGTNAIALSKILDELNVDGAGASEVFAKLGKNTEMLSGRVLMATDSLKKQDSIVQSYKLRNDNLAGSLEKISKVISSWLIPTSFIMWLEKIVGLFAKWTEIPLSATLEKERIEVNMLASKLTDANIKAEERNKIYEKLKEINPAIVEGINSENISINTLTENLKKYNQEMLNKIIIQKKDEQIAVKRQKAADLFLELDEQEKKIRTGIETIKKQFSNMNKDLVKKVTEIELDPNLSGLEKMNKILSMYNSEIKDNLAFRLKYGLRQDIVKTGKTLFDYTETMKEYNDEMKKSLSLEEDKKLMMKELGMTGQEQTVKNESKKDKEGDEKIVDDVLMVYKGGKWQVKKTEPVTPENKYKNSKDAKESKKETDEFDLSSLDAFEKFTEENTKTFQEYFDEIFNEQLKFFDEKQQTDILLKELEMTSELEMTAFKKQQLDERLKFYQDWGVQVGNEVLQKQLEIKEAETKKEKEAYDEKVKMSQDFINMTSNSLFQFASGNKEALKQYGKDVLMFVLDLLERKAQLAVAGVTIEGLASLNPFQMVAAAVKIGLIKAAFATVKGVVSKQFAEGRYNVIGSKDRKSYSVPYLGVTKTGIISKPALISENGSEAIIDHRTLYNPQKDQLGMSVMDHFQAIKAIKYNQAYPVIQFAEGLYPQLKAAVQQNTTQQQNIINQTDPALIELLQELKQQIKEGIRADVNYFEFERAKEKMDGIRNNTSL
jgi:TP901 family phage tail tape measure protein